jgi:hypothetical protein
MKHLLSILLICSIGFTQELTVDGNLNVTGNIANQTIDSLMQVIADLQSQLNALQGGNRLGTRVFELPRFEFLRLHKIRVALSSLYTFMTQQGLHHLFLDPLKSAKQ